jgi:hypothetical protein
MCTVGDFIVAFAPPACFIYDITADTWTEAPPMRVRGFLLPPVAVDACGRIVIFGTDDPEVDEDDLEIELAARLRAPDANLPPDFEAHAEILGEMFGDPIVLERAMARVVGAMDVEVIRARARFERGSERRELVFPFIPAEMGLPDFMERPGFVQWLDPANGGTWSERHTLPNVGPLGFSPVIHTAVAVGDAVYVVGGMNLCEDDLVFENAMHKLTIPANASEQFLGTWQKCASLPCPSEGAIPACRPPRGHHRSKSNWSLLSKWGKLYATGGSLHHEHSRVCVSSMTAVYDPATDTWARLPDMPTPRCGMPLLDSEEHLFFAAGGWGGRGSEAVLEQYDLEAGRWTPLQGLDLLKCEHGFGCFKVENLAPLRDDERIRSPPLVLDPSQARWLNWAEENIRQTLAEIAEQQGQQRVESA